MALFTRSLWPESVRAPYRRLVGALVVSSVLVSALLTLTAFVLAAMSEQTTGAVIAVTIDSGIAIGMLVAMFAVTFGLLGVAVLWALSQRGMLAWMTTGLLFGAVAGMLFGGLATKDFARALVVVFAVSGLAFFVLVRLFAGIQDESRRG